MIYTVTLNPCIDRTVFVDSFEVGATNRTTGYEINVCGKGINTSVALRNLGYDSEAFIFDYKDGTSVPSYLKTVGIKCSSVKVDGEIRLNIKINDKSNSKVTEFNENGVPVNEEAVEKMFRLITSKVKDGDILILSGSTPPGVSDTFYMDVINSVKEKGVYTVLDADGELLKNGIKACPDLVKPNKDELASLIGFVPGSTSDVAKAAKLISSKGIKSVCVSMGKEGAVFFSEGLLLHAINHTEEIQGTVGAGDSMIAGFVMALSEGKSPEDTLRYASAVAAGSVSLPSTNMCTNELFHEMLPKVELLYL